MTAPRSELAAETRAAADSRPAWVEIDLEALDANLVAVRERVAPAGVLAVIKADAYGHGSREVGRALERAGVDWLGVALIEEGVELRRAGVRTPVLVLESGRADHLDLYRRHALTPTLSSLDALVRWIERAAAQPVPLPFHLKIDTGMTRLGLSLGETDEALARLRPQHGLQLAGLLSHFAEADEPESAANDVQAARFAEVLARLTAAEADRVLVHMANSAAALHRPSSRHALVRSGLALFGHDPAGRVDGLEPVMSVVARVAQLRRVAAGTRVGYGGRWTAPRESEIAVLPVGYADGYPWRLGSRGEVLFAGRRAPVVGSVTMDMTLVDVTGLGVAVGEEALLLGRSGDDRIGVDELAERAGTLSYEVLCRLGLRLQRRYVRGDEVVAVDSRFHPEWP